VVAVRPAGPADAESVARIYSEGIADRSATFETAPRTGADVLGWLAAGERLPLLVAEADGRVLGWARILAYSDRAAYAGVGEVSTCSPRISSLVSMAGPYSQPPRAPVPRRAPQPFAV
jgi:L-amino acid N-acyltransferase YncA